MKIIQGTGEIFKVFFRLGLKKTRTRFFIFFSLSPILLIILIKSLEIAGLINQGGTAEFSANMISFLFFNFLIPIMAIFLGSGVIKEEIDDKTLCYLTSRPISKMSILLGKFAAYLSIFCLVIATSLIIMSLIANLNNLGNIHLYTEIIGFCLAAFLSILTYSTVFMLLSTLFNRVILFSLLYVFGWENIVQYLPGTTQKLTIAHYVKSLLPFSTSQGSFLITQFESTAKIWAILTLLVIAGISLFLSGYLFNRKEYVL
jgi:ABC-2 type transport system permease protein